MLSVLTKAEGLENRFFKLSQRKELLTETISGLKTTYAAKQEDYEKLLEEVEVHGESIETMKKLIGVLSEEGIQKLKGLLTYGLKTIFRDHSYAIDIEIDERGNKKTAVFYLIDEEKELRVVLKDSVGGGIMSVVSLIIRVYFMVQLGMRRFLVLDESLSQVSQTYVEGLFQFLHHLVDDLEYEILFISHDPRFTEHATKTYEVSGGTVRLRKAK